MNFRTVILTVFFLVLTIPISFLDRHCFVSITNRCHEIIWQKSIYWNPHITIKISSKSIVQQLVNLPADWVKKIYLPYRLEFDILVHKEAHINLVVYCTPNTSIYHRYRFYKGNCIIILFEILQHKPWVHTILKCM